MRPISALVDAYADRLDCMQANLAGLASASHGAHAALHLGAALDFVPRQGEDGLPTIEPTIEGQIANCEKHIGLRLAGRRSSPSIDASGIDPATGPIYAIADAYHLPWVPYHAQQHMDHSFIVEQDVDGLRIRDHYWNDTPWGSARPGTWSSSAAELAQALPHGAQLFTFDPSDARPSLPEPRYVAPSHGEIESYVGAYAAYPDRQAALKRLTLETWLLVRSRRLHAALRARLDPAWTGLDATLGEWKLIAEQTYLALRRVQRGHPEPRGVIERLGALLMAERDLLAAPTLRERVAAEIASVLQVEIAFPLSGGSLRECPTFNSYRMIEIIERLEERLHLSFDPADLVPENLHKLDDLCRIATAGTGGEP